MKNQLADMVYKSFLPNPPLRAFVRNYTIIHFKFDSSQAALTKQRSPKPEQKIVFYLKGPPSLQNPATGNAQSPPPVAIFSHQREQRTIQLTDEFFAFIIFLQPGVLHRLIRLPMMEILHQAIEAELFFGTEVRDIREQLMAAKSHASMIAIAEQFLLAKCKQSSAINSIDTVALQLLSDPTLFNVNVIARQACLSTKQFYRRFTEQIGISPKLFSRLSRFNHAYRFKVMHPSVSWSSIAQEFCYTDYHHLEKEFKEFTGFTPKCWTNTHLAAPERLLRLR